MSETHPNRHLCPVHGIPDCSPLLNGCSKPERLSPEAEAALQLALVRLLNLSVRQTHPTSFVQIGGWVGVDPSAIPALEGRGLVVVGRDRTEARLTRAGVDVAQDIAATTERTTR